MSCLLQCHVCSLIHKFQKWGHILPHTVPLFLVSPHVLKKGGAESKTPPTLMAFIQFHSHVNSLVCCKVWAAIKAFPALQTLEKFFFDVDSTTPGNISATLNCFPTFHGLLRLLSSVKESTTNLLRLQLPIPLSPGQNIVLESSPLVSSTADFYFRPLWFWQSSCCAFNFWLGRPKFRRKFLQTWNWFLFFFTWVLVRKNFLFFPLFCLPEQLFNLSELWLNTLNSSVHIIIAFIVTQRNWLQ